ncbi:MAG: DUF3306 domain-containing protein [Pseudomonadota bacterium]
MAKVEKPETGATRREGPPAETRSADETFVARWARLKREARTEDAAPQQPLPPARDAAPDLPALDSLTPDSDFAPFMHPKVEQVLRRTAIKKLFSDPHFNVMDGLDIYIDDYSKFEAIEPDVLASLTHTVEHLVRTAPKKAGESVAPEVAAESPPARLSEQAADAAPGGQTPGPEQDLAQADLERGKDGDGVPGVDAGSTNDRIDGEGTPA